MDDRKAQAGAVGVALLALGVLSWITLRPHAVRLKLLSQRPVGKGGGPLGSGPGILISLDIAPQGEHLASDYQVRLWDDRGVEMPIKALYVPGESDFLVPLGYARPVAKPRAEAWLNGKREGSLPLQAFPPPTDVPLAARHDSTYQLERRPAVNEIGGSSLTLKCLKPLPKGVCVVATLVRTEHKSDLDQALAMFGEPGVLSSSAGATLAYGQDESSAEVRLDTYRVVERSQDLPLPPIRLALRNGETSAVVDHDQTIPNRLGCDLILRKRPAVTMRPSPVDHRQVSIDLSLTSFDRGRPRFAQPGYSVRLLSPSPPSVGLAALAIGAPPLLPKERIPTASPPASIQARVRLTRTDYVRTGSTKIVLPIVDGVGPVTESMAGSPTPTGVPSKPKVHFTP